jgi:hypothetical protein
MVVVPFPSSLPFCLSKGVRRMTRVIALMAAVILSGGVAMIRDKERTIFDFDRRSDAEQWQPINDTVMGGVSDSRMQVTDKGTAVFAGKVSLENNGGFASVRSRPADFDLSGFDGITLRVKGDGKRYKLCIKTDARFDGVLYQANFTTQQDAWIAVRIPFSEFVPTYHGMILRNVPAIDRRSVKSFSLMISDKQAGAFNLEIDWAKAYRGT